MLGGGWYQRRRCATVDVYRGCRFTLYLRAPQGLPSCLRGPHALELVIFFSSDIEVLLVTPNLSAGQPSEDGV